MTEFQCPVCRSELRVGAVTPDFLHEGAVRVARKPVRVSVVRAAGTALLHWLADPGRTLPTDEWVLGTNVHEQFLDWALRRDLAPFTQRVTLTALSRHAGAADRRKWDGSREYLVPPAAAPDEPAPVWSEEWAARLDPLDYPWVRRAVDLGSLAQSFASELGVSDPSKHEEGLAWSEAHRWARPPQAGWPWWRIPLPGEEVPK